MKSAGRSLYTISVIASKDVLGVLKDKNSLLNLLVIIALVVFFFWFTNIRPWDKQIDAIVLDQGRSGLAMDRQQELDGYTLTFHPAASQREMVDLMVSQSRNLVIGLVFPAEFEQALQAQGEISIDGYLLWVKRGQMADLELFYSRIFSDLLGREVSFVIGENLVQPPPGLQSSNTSFILLVIAFWMALTVAQLMLEEKGARTWEALAVSPASAAQLVAGKALAGVFFVGLAGGLAFALNWACVTNWGQALLAFLGAIFLAVAAGLALGSFLSSGQQLYLWGLGLNLALLIPALIALDPLLIEGLRKVFYWLPTTALIKMFQYAFSSGVTPALFWGQAAIVLAWTGVVFLAVVWKVSLQDR